MLNAVIRLCQRCDEEKDVSEFGIHKWCKKCFREYIKEWRNRPENKIKGVEYRSRPEVKAALKIASDKCYDKKRVGRIKLAEEVIAARRKQYVAEYNAKNKQKIKVKQELLT